MFTWFIIEECEQPTTGGGCCNEACKPGSGPDEGKYWCNTDDGSWDWCDENFLLLSTTAAPTTANATGENMVLYLIGRRVSYLLTLNTLLQTTAAFVCSMAPPRRLGITAQITTTPRTMCVCDTLHCCIIAKYTGG